MSFIAAAIIGGVAVVGGAVIASQGAKSAANTQANAQMNAAQIGQNEFNTITAQEQPWMQSGYGAQNQLNYLMGIGSPQGYGQGGQYGATPGVTNTGMPVQYGGGGSRLSDVMGSRYRGAGGAGGGTPGVPPGAPANPNVGGGFGSLLDPFTIDKFHQMSPAYQFQLQQGGQGTLNSMNPNSSALSPAAQKELMSFNQNYANTAFNNAFNQYQTQQGNIYQRLSGISQLGQAAASNTGQQGTALASNIGQSVASAGAAQAAGQVGSANAYSGALSSLGGLYAAYGGGGGYGQYGAAGLSPQSVNTPMLPIAGP